MTDQPSPTEAPKMLGLVDGSVDGSTSQFCVAVDPDAVVQLDDLVCVTQDLPDGRTLTHYGIVSELHSRLEGVEWASDNADAHAGHIPSQPVTVATVQVLRTSPELWMAPRPASVVSAATGADRDTALFADQMNEKLCVGIDQSGQPVHADWRFMNGQMGGHISVTGVSGVASKTSYLSFLLYQLLETPQGSRLLGQQAGETRCLMFNAKGEDSLHLDSPNGRYTEFPQAPAQWAACGSEQPGVFTDVEFYCPPVAGGSLVAAVESRPTESVTAFGWTPWQFVRRGLLAFCVSDQDDRRTQVGMVEQRVRVQLARHAYPHSDGSGALVIDMPPSQTGFTFDRVAASSRPEKSSGPFVIRDFSELVDFLVEQAIPIGGPQWAGDGSDWTAGVNEGTLGAFHRRLMALVPRMGRLVRCDVTPPTLDRKLSVVDLHDLHDVAQRFAVGAILHEIFAAKQGQGREPLRIVVLDELNKYAPKTGDSPLKDLLVDIAERGRSLGVLLWGAQQSSLDVEPAIIRNAALKVAGRLDASEAGDYRFLTPSMRERATRFLPGSMVLAQPIIPSPLPVRFPMPSWATSVSEAREHRDDAARASVEDLLSL